MSPVITGYSTTCRNCGKRVSTKAPDGVDRCRIRCSKCGTTNYTQNKFDPVNGE